MTFELQGRRAFTIVEMLVATAIFSIVSVAMLGFSSMSTRLIARNLATNHSHNSVRLAAGRLCAELRNSGSAYKLVNYDGSANNDVSPTPSAEIEALTNQLLSAQQSNAVRFYKLLAGPCRLTSTPSATSKTLTFTCATILEVNDRLSMPLIGDDFTISAVSRSGTSQTVTVDHAIAYNFLDSSANITTGTFYRPVAYSVIGGKLCFHPRFQGSTKNTYTVIANNITTTTPFSLLYLADSTLTAGKQIYVSIGANDSQYSKQKLIGGATSLQTVVTLLDQNCAVKD